MTFTLPYPSGVGSSGELAALCSVSGYWPGANPPLSWNCNWAWDDANRQATFTVATGGASIPGEGMIIGRALLINRRTFELADSQVASIRSGEIGTIPLNVPAAGTVAVPTVLRYDPAGATGFGYTITPTANNSYEVRGFDGNANSVIDVALDVFRPVTGAYYASFSPVDNTTDTSIETTFAQDLEAVHFSTLTTYQPNGGQDFAALSRTVIEPLYNDSSHECSTSNPMVAGSLCLSTYLNGFNGASQSYAEVMSYLFQLTASME
jgi:hypothetical protein